MRWKLVPETPSVEMIRKVAGLGNNLAAYREMVFAAPPASQDEELVEGVRELVAENLMCVDVFRDDHVLTRAMSMDIARAVLKMLEGDE